jgi:predicted ArsR family transcriptional regulator
LPQRQYDLAGEILAAAVEDAARDAIPVLEAVRRAADDAGHRLGAEQGGRNGSAGASALEDLAAVLAVHGYEPHVEGDAIVLANCPFYALARAHTGLVCRMNLNLITAILDQLGRPDVQAGLDPAPDRCCVRLAAARS